MHTTKNNQEWAGFAAEAWNNSRAVTTTLHSCIIQTKFTEE